MTMVPGGGDSAVAPYTPPPAALVTDVEGLEDIEASDLVIPRIKIDHPAGNFVNSLSKQVYPTLRAVILGLIKQRAMWPAELEDGDKPLCKSTDFVHGFPNLDPRAADDKRFPFGESGFTPASAQPVIIPAGTPGYPGGWNSNGHLVLPCNSCRFQQWGQKAGKPVPPPCAEQHTYAIMVTPDDGVTWQAALVTFQKTGIKPSKRYASSFTQSRQPMFTVETEITLTVNKRGMVYYAVPEFTRGAPTDPAMWPEFATTYRSIRDLIRSAPRNDADESPTEDATSLDEDDPWAKEAAAAAPVAPAAPSVPPAPAAPAPAQATPAPAAAPAPSPVKTTPAPAPAAVVEDDDDLPF